MKKRKINDEDITHKKVILRNIDKVLIEEITNNDWINDLETTIIIDSYKHKIKNKNQIEQKILQNNSRDFIVRLLFYPDYLINKSKKIHDHYNNYEKECNILTSEKYFNISESINFKDIKKLPNHIDDHENRLILTITGFIGRDLDIQNTDIIYEEFGIIDGKDTCNQMLNIFRQIVCPLKEGIENVNNYLFRFLVLALIVLCKDFQIKVKGISNQEKFAEFVKALSDQLGGWFHRANIKNDHLSIIKFVDEVCDRYFTEDWDPVVPSMIDECKHNRIHNVPYVPVGYSNEEKKKWVASE